MSDTYRPVRLRVSRSAETHLRGGHPWLYESSVREVSRPGDTGELAVIYDRKDRFLAIGLYDPISPIRVRILHMGKPQRIDDSWWREHFRTAVARREGLFGSATDGYRLVNGESDGWPGFVLDRYGSACVLKLYTAVWIPWLGRLKQAVIDGTGAETIVLRLSRNAADAFRQKAGLEDGQTIHGIGPDGPVVFQENGLRFEADLVRGQKTGFFLDQRDNRAVVRELAGGCDVLNVFSFSGAFSVSAAAGGAKSVTDLDISRHALESARRNFELNATIPGVQHCICHNICADAFQWLKEERKEVYDLVVVDPPSLAKKEVERERAIAAYRQLFSNGCGKGGSSWLPPAPRMWGRESLWDC